MAIGVAVGKGDGAVWGESRGGGRRWELDSVSV